MSTPRRAAAAAAAMLTLLSASAATVSHAQAAAAGRGGAAEAAPAYATVILVEDIGAPDARAVVIRRPGELPNNIILVTRATTPRDLATAVSALITSRANRGNDVDREIRTRIAPQAPRAKPTASERLAGRDLRRLPLAPVFEVPGVGRGPALVVRMNDSMPGKAR